jgi:hypothetical protein
MENAASEAVVTAVAEALFKERPSRVTEAYSEFESEPVDLRSAEEFCAYVESRRGVQGYAHCAVLYPDMAGRLTTTRVELDPAHCKGATFRFTAEGWGLIRIYLKLSSVGGQKSFISANTEKRALKWAPTIPELESPSTWHWPAVARHERRLRRALERSA